MNHSTAIVAISAALVAAQKSIGAASKSAANPFFKSKYADLGSVMEACKGPLLDQGIAVLQLVGKDESGPYLDTVLMHSSGEWISDKMPIVCAKQNDPQAMGSAISYARRYALQSACFIPAEDDDGEKAMTRTEPAKETKKKFDAIHKEIDKPNEKKAAPVGAGKRRDRMIEVLVKENNLPQAAIEDFALKSDILKAGERITDWPDDCVPSSADGMAKLVRHIGWFMQGMSVEEIDAEEITFQSRQMERAPKKEEASWMDMSVPFGKSKGIKFGAMPDDDLRWLFDNFSVKEKDADGNPKKPAFIAKDKLIRDALDAAGVVKGWTK